MYGAVKQSSAWVWGAFGKHPVVKDYIRLGSQAPIINAFSRWVEEGYQKVGSKTSLHSWRFFAKGMKSEELSCGLIRDSHDGAGRPFPLLIMGYGPFKGWEQQWDHIPTSLDALWERLEFLCAKRILDLNEFKSDINRLSAPILPKESKPLAGSSHEISLEQGGRFAVLLEDAGDHPQEIRQWLTSLKAHLKTIPEAIFIGGPLERSFLAVFTRPLSAADFEWLWAMN